MSNEVGRIFKSPGKGLQKYRVIGFDGQAYAIEIESHSGRRVVTTFGKYHFESLTREAGYGHGKDPEGE
jgi:hypothetical protein